MQPDFNRRRVRIFIYVLHFARCRVILREKKNILKYVFDFKIAREYNMKQIEYQKKGGCE